MLIGSTPLVRQHRRIASCMCPVKCHMHSEAQRRLYKHSCGMCTCARHPLIIEVGHSVAACETESILPIIEVVSLRIMAMDKHLHSDGPQKFAEFVEELHK